jgi:hypothetical protein
MPENPWVAVIPNILREEGENFFFERVKQWERVPLQFFIDWENLQSVQIYSVKKVKVAKRKKFMLQCVANLQIDHGISSLFWRLAF